MLFIPDGCNLFYALFCVTVSPGDSCEHLRPLCLSGPAKSNVYKSKKRHLEAPDLDHSLCVNHVPVFSLYAAALRSQWTSCLPLILKTKHVAFWVRRSLVREGGDVEGFITTVMRGKFKPRQPPHLHIAA